MDFQVKEIPVSERCKEILEKREHALVGISPFNSYYSEENITKLICWAKNNFKDFHVIFPDQLPYYNLIAAGYSEERTIQKLKHQIRNFRSKINRAFITNAIPEEERHKKTLLISHFSNNPIYCDLYNRCSERYLNDHQFKKTCNDSSAVVLRNYTANIETSILDVAAKYVLGELPFYMDTPKLLNVNSSLLVYHLPISFFTNLYKTNTDNFVAFDQGHLILKFI